MVKICIKPWFFYLACLPYYGILNFKEGIGQSFKALNVEGFFIGTNAVIHICALRMCITVHFSGEIITATLSAN
jgi:hypothetical protein